MKLTEFYREMESVLELETGIITGTEQLADLPGWDSMGVLSFIAMADNKLGVMVSASSVIECQSVGDLVKICDGKVSD